MDGHRFERTHARMRSRQKPALLYQIALRLFRVIVWFRFKVTVIGQLPDEGVIVGNHQSGWDGIILGIKMKTPVYALVMQEMFQNPIAERILTGINMVPLQARYSDNAAIETMQTLIHNGNAVMVFPEGVRNRDVLGEPKRGAARIALDTWSPITPVLLTNTSKAARRWRRPHVVVRVGETVHPSSVTDKPGSTPETASALTETVWVPIRQMWQER